MNQNLDGKTPRERIKERLIFLYGESSVEKVYQELDTLMQKYLEGPKSNQNKSWDEKDVFVITYGDTFINEENPPLTLLKKFLNTYIKDAVSLLHILPFYPFTSDDGFSVVDYRKVNPELGDWEHIKDLGKDYRLVFDAVINHVSSKSHYMEKQCAGDPNFKDFLLTLDPSENISAVVRPRNLPLLHEFKTSEGKKWFWTTFSRDQIDFNFKNPKVLLEIIDILLLYGSYGSEMIRLDAIPFLWKELGTTCSHLPQTHAIIKLIRDVMDVVYPKLILLSETNVPHKENISYFGNKGDEAQVIYNFSLAPLILHSIHSESAKVLSKWAGGISKVGDRATFLNITATHDGIGVRPTEGLLTEEERNRLVNMAKDHGGRVNEKRNPDGSVSPYELNVTYFDAVNNPNDNISAELSVKRFLLTQMVPLAFIGIPGIYIHSLIGSRNDYEGVENTGAARSINRRKIPFPELENELEDSSHLRRMVLDRYLEVIHIRKQQPAFHPNTPQEILNWGDNLLVIKREQENQGQGILAIYNFSSQTSEVDSSDIPESASGDLLDESLKLGAGEKLMLGGFQVRWITYKVG